MMLRWILLAASVIFQSEAAEEDVGDAFATAQLSVSEVFDGNPLTSDEVESSESINIPIKNSTTKVIPTH